MQHKDKILLEKAYNLIVESSDLTNRFGSWAHDEWRKGWEKQQGGPRIKKNSDGTEGNINVPFDELHLDWKKENLAAGQAALEAVHKFPADEEAGSNYIHQKWMERNPKQDWNASQHVSYDQLSEPEKEKDRVHYRVMKKLIG